MARRWSICLFTISLLLGLALLAWGFDRSQTIKWVGSTNLEVEFRITSAESDQPIRGARIQVLSHGGFYDDGEAEGPFELQTDAAGMAGRHLRNNMCIGTVSGLRFTNTYHVYVPTWRLRVSAAGYEPSAWVDLNAEYRGKVQHEGPQRDRLTIRILLQKKCLRAPSAICHCRRDRA